MASEEDELPIRLTVALNEVAERDGLGKLPDDLKGDVIPKHILAHEAALAARATQKQSESGARGEHNDDVDRTERLLSRLRMGILASYDDAQDPRLAKYGRLGIAATAKDNHERLSALAEAVKAPLAAGEIALVADLHPAALASHVAAQREGNVEKFGSIAGRQVASTSLTGFRRTSEKLLQRVKNHVKSHYPGELEAFGFGVPAPAERPRLKVGEPDRPPA